MPIMLIFFVTAALILFVWAAYRYLPEPFKFLLSGFFVLLYIGWLGNIFGWWSIRV
jgi:hypothetical protein